MGMGDRAAAMGREILSKPFLKKRVSHGGEGYDSDALADEARDTGHALPGSSRNFVFLGSLPYFCFVEMPTTATGKRREASPWLPQVALSRKGLMNLTAKSVAALKLDGKTDIIFFDDTLSCFGYRLRLSHDRTKVLRSWVVQARLQGR